jgi:hypothetical protein
VPKTGSRCPTGFVSDGDYCISINWLWGTILITLAPTVSDTKITAVSTGNVDNIFSLFKSPNKTILSAFKKGLR